MIGIPETLRSSFVPIINGNRYVSNSSRILETKFMGGNTVKERVGLPYYNGRLTMSIVLSDAQLRTFLRWGRDDLKNYTQAFLWNFALDLQITYSEAQFVVKANNTVNFNKYGADMWRVEFELDVREVITSVSIPDEYCDIIDSITYDQFAEILRLLHINDIRFNTINNSINNLWRGFNG